MIRSRAGKSSRSRLPNPEIVISPAESEIVISPAESEIVISSAESEIVISPAESEIVIHRDSVSRCR